MASRRLRFSRWKRLPPGLHRSGERPSTRPEDALERLSLYLPGSLLDLAEALARRRGEDSVQAYCERLLSQAIADDGSRARLEASESRRGVLDAIDALVADDLQETAIDVGDGDRAPGLLVEVMYEEPRGPDSHPLRWNEAGDEEEPESGVQEGTAEMAVGQPEEHVLWEAGLCARGQLVGERFDERPGFLECLRRGEPIAPDLASALVSSISSLERSWSDERTVDRRIAFALHRLALESQLLVSEAWPGLASDAPTVAAVRRVQEAVDRALSGEDIRYDGAGAVHARP